MSVNLFLCEAAGQCYNPSSMPEKSHLILTAIGPDRVGLVEKLSEFISRRDCNIEDSKMAAFCGEFAVIILITGDGSQLAKVARDYREIESETGLTIALKAPSARNRISGVLSQLAVNIESMETKTYSAPMSGTPLFQLEAELAVPVRTNINQLRERLADVQRDENIDIEITVIKG